MSVYRLEDWEPKIHPSAFVAPEAVVIGQVEVGEGASLWFGAVARGDAEKIVIGAGTNVQDGAILHADPGDPCLLGKNVTVGHRAVVHGATVEDGALIGIGAVVLNKAKIGKGAVVGAGALVPMGMEVPGGTLVVGVPAKVKGPAEKPTHAPRYRALAQRYKGGLYEVKAMPRYRLTLRGQDALNPFSDLHLSLKREHPQAIGLLRSVAEGKLEGLEGNSPILQLLLREGLLSQS
ncbi:MAG: gamma carbonic anhydrase family protein [Deinococcota bacterium]|uniref:Ferripyochelin-binding protein n=1 Tax=Allomeiothermus silvanus (strain ATCC 700542 / DSM 9946 / NBRC 106475 / NCIMB 13440 / VI-R2) TaxID=526227 RepID=D7BCF2_ALLS1|nr:gamma carbonic anhydrase family protein [Allomeiothermus silvanus]ADH62837.1 ferripyochelin-binding protein [Allomeiothermus silvanus DSM 9946]